MIIKFMLPFKLCCFLLLSFSSISLPYTLATVLPEPQHQVRCIELSADDSMLVAGSIDGNIYVYALNDTAQFEHKYTLTESTDKVRAVDLTPDKQWLLAIDESGSALVYKENSSTNRLELLQTLSVAGDSSGAYAGVMADNHAWVGFGKLSGGLYIFTFDGSSFTLLGYISQNAMGIWSMSLTSDMEYLAVAVSSYINVFSVSYVNQNLGFTFSHRLTFSHSNHRNVELNDDFVYMLVANGASSDSFVYSNNGSGFEVMNHMTDTAGFSYQDTVTSDFKYLVRSTQTGTFLYEDLGEKNDGQSLTDKHSDSCALSGDDELLIVGMIGEIQIFQRNRTCLDGTFYDSQEWSCESCLDGCIACESVATCTACERTHQLVNGQCLWNNASECSL